MITKARVEVTKRKRTEPDTSSVEDELLLQDLYAKSTLVSDPDRKDTTSGRCVLLSGVSLDQFLKLIEREKLDQSKGQLMFANGNIIIYELPTGQHHGGCFASILVQLGPHLGGCAYGSEQLKSNIPAAWSKQPDGWITPNGKPRPGHQNNLRSSYTGAAWPNVIVEVGHSDTVNDILEDCGRWLGPNTTVQVVIAFKIYSVRIGANGGITFPIVAMRFRRAQPLIPDVLISFGNRRPHPATMQSFANRAGWPAMTGNIAVGAAACNAAGIPGYQLPLLSADLFFGDVAPAGAPVSYNIDLFAVLQNLLSA